MDHLIPKECVIEKVRVHHPNCETYGNNYTVNVNPTFKRSLFTEDVSSTLWGTIIKNSVLSIVRHNVTKPFEEIGTDSFVRLGIDDVVHQDEI